MGLKVMPSWYHKGIPSSAHSRSPLELNQCHFPSPLLGLLFVFGRVDEILNLLAEAVSVTLLALFAVDISSTTTAGVVLALLCTQVDVRNDILGAAAFGSTLLGSRDIAGTTTLRDMSISALRLLLPSLKGTYAC